MAAGAVAAYVVFRGTALHCGAGALLAAEAGATVTDVYGAPWTLESDSILACANPALQAQLVAISSATAPSG